jgi:tetratricopeptide (TPR) repeat protein
LNRSRIIAWLAGILALGAAGGAPAAEPSDGPQAKDTFTALEAALASRAEAKGDRWRAAEEWLEALERYAGTPAAEVLVRRIEEFDPSSASGRPGRPAEDSGVEPRRAAAVYARLLKAKPRIGGRVRELISDRLARRYRAVGSFGRAEAVEREMGYVNKWAVSGPFGYTYRSVHYQVFPPEREIDFEKPMRAGMRTVKWRFVEAPLSGRRVDLFAPLWPKEGCAYALAQVRSRSSQQGGREAALVVHSAASCKVWWNGSAVLDADKNLRYTPREHVRRVRLRRGWNRLLVKVAAVGSAISCRLVEATGDERGLPVERLEWEDRLELHDVGKVKAARAPGARGGEGAEPTGLGAEGALGRLLRARQGRPNVRGSLTSGEPGDLAKGREALLRAALGIMARSDGRWEEALSQLERAVELLPERPHLWYQLARAVEVAEVLPPSVRRTRAQEAYEKAASLPGGFVPADEAIAGRLRRDRHPERAITHLKEVAKRLDGEGPIPHIKLALAEVALGEGWTHEARRWAEDAERAGPSWRPVHTFWGRFHLAQGNVPRAVASYREAISLDAADTASREALAGMYLDQGRFGPAVTELRSSLEADPGRLAGYLTLARAELDERRYGDAENTLHGARRLAPGSPTVHRRLGELYFRQGNTEKALAAWDEALAAYPGWHNLRRQVEALRGKQDDFTSPYPIDVRKAIGESKSSDDYPRADEILVVDQTVDRIYEDGSYSEITHQARKAITTDGAEDLSHITVDGELIEARTHLPDGTVLEPVILPGKRELTMPGVQVGSVVEYKYRDDHPAAKGGFVMLPRWYFRSLKTPHQFSDYVVIAPKSMNLSIIVKNWSEKYSEEKLIRHPPITKGDLKTYRWISRNTRPLDAGGGHDHISTLLPHVLVGRPRSWQDMNWEVLDLFLGRTRITRALEKEAEAALEAAPGAQPGPRPGRGKTRRKEPGDRAKTMTPDEASSRVEAIFRHVNKLVKAKADLYGANHILICRAGNRAVLLAALLAAAGIDADFAVTRPRAETIPPEMGPGEPTWALPAPGLFRDTIVCATLADGRKLWLDPDGPYSPFAAIVPKFQGGIVYVVSREGGQLTTLPWRAIRDHGETTRTKLAFDPAAAGWRGTLEVLRSGSAGGAFKERFADSSSSWRDTWAEKRLSDCFRGSGSGARLEKIEMVAIEDPERPFHLRAVFGLDAAFDTAGPWRDVPMCLQPLGVSKRFSVQTGRQYPQKISSPLVRRDEVKITVRGVEAWGPPESHAEQTAFGSYNLAFTWEGDTLTVRRSVTVMPQLVSPERYGEFVRFCRRVDAAEAAPLRAKFPATQATPDERR